MQSFTWCFAMGFDPGGEHVIDKPEQYERWRDYVPNSHPAWPGTAELDARQPITLKPMAQACSTEPGKFHRTVRCIGRSPTEGTSRPATAGECHLVNWPQNDYWLGNLFDDADRRAADARRADRQLSRSLLLLDADRSPAARRQGRLEGAAPPPRHRGHATTGWRRPRTSASRAASRPCSRSPRTTSAPTPGEDARQEAGEFTAEKFADSRRHRQLPHRPAPHHRRRQLHRHRVRCRSRSRSAR